MPDRQPPEVPEVKDWDDCAEVNRHLLLRLIRVEDNIHHVHTQARDHREEVRRAIEAVRETIHEVVKEQAAGEHELKNAIQSVDRKVDERVGKTNEELKGISSKITFWAGGLAVLGTIVLPGTLLVFGAWLKAHFDRTSEERRHLEQRLQQVERHDPSK